MSLDPALLELIEARTAARRRSVTRRHPDLLTVESVERLKREVDRRLRRSVEEARRTVAAAEHLASEIDAPAARGRAVLARAFLLHGTSRYAEACARYEEAAELLRGAGDRTAASRVLLPRIDGEARAGHDAVARRIASQARRAFARRGEPRWIAMVDMNLGNVHHRAGRLSDALRAYERASRILESEGAGAGVAVNDVNRANVMALVGRHDEARSLYSSSAAFFRERGQDSAAARAEYDIAVLHLLEGEFAAALTALSDVEERFAAQKDRQHQALVRMDRAEILLRLGQPDSAAVEADRARRLFRRLRLDAEAALAAGIAALARAEVDSPARARRAVARAASELKDHGWSAWAAALGVHEAGLALRAGDPDGAAAVLRRVLPILRRAELPDREALALLVRARCDEVRDRLTAARKGYRAVLDRLGDIPLRWITWRAHHGLARLARKARDRREASRRFAAAVRDLEAVKDSLAGDEIRGGLLEEAVPLYEDHVLFLLEGRSPRRVELAFDLLERARSRTLLAGLEGMPAAARLRGHPRAEALLEELRKLQRQVASALHDPEPGNGRRTSPPRLRAPDLRRAERRVRALQVRLESLAGPGVLPERPLALGADEVRRILRPSETVLAYASLRGRLVAFIVDEAGVSGPHDLADARTLDRLVADLRHDLTRPSSRTAFRAAARASAERRLRELRCRLIEPIEDRLGTGRLMVVPWGSLHSVPFHALLDDRGPLAADREVVRLPSAGVLWLVRGRPRGPGRRAVVLGVPDRRAPRVAEECAAIVHHLSTPIVACGAEATSGLLRREAPRAAILHVATHGLYRAESPRLAAFLLADGWFGLSDVYGLPLRADLAVLASCDGGLGGVLRGGDTLGLARGFLLAGARSFLSSLGPVRDDAAALFMEAIYGGLRKGLSVSAAHREATLVARETFEHPAQWGLFVLDGDGAVRPRGVAP